VSLAESGKGLIPHNVLNARLHEQKPFIVLKRATGSITIATNMAGPRAATDIQLSATPTCCYGGPSRHLAKLPDDAARKAELARRRGDQA